jgi:hypothetical protein
MLFLKKGLWYTVFASAPATAGAEKKICQSSFLSIVMNEIVFIFSKKIFCNSNQSRYCCCCSSSITAAVFSMTVKNVIYVKIIKNCFDFDLNTNKNTASSTFYGL